MTLLDSIHSALSGVLTGAGKFWNTKLEPWFESFLSTVSHDGAKIAVAAATDLVNQEAPALAKAVATQDWNTFADTQATILKATGVQLLQNEESVVVTDGAAAVMALITAHPAVAAASSSLSAAGPTGDGQATAGTQGGAPSTVETQATAASNQPAG